MAVFYGRNRADYYLTEGLPLLLTTALPFAVVGLWQGLSLQASQQQKQPSEEAKAQDVENPTILSRLAWTSLIVTASLSLIAHKEVRFLYPILPFLQVLAAKPFTTFFPSQLPLSRRALLTLLLSLNLLIAGYASQVHQRGVIDVVSFIRHKHEARNYHPTSGTGAEPRTSMSTTSNTTAAFLMPCHSTPWRSHLVHPGITAWALTCEPPLDVPPSDRPAYLDEADAFFLSPGPAGWLRENMEPVDVVSAAGGSRSSRHWGRVDPNVELQRKRAGRRAWPDVLVFFAQLEDVMRDVLGGSLYGECWRGFNSQWHDDWRRRGDVVVWCLGEE